MISEGGNIYGKVDFSVLFPGVTVEEGAEIRDSIICRVPGICRGAVVQYAIVAENAVIGEGAVVGARPETVENLKDWGRGGGRLRRPRGRGNASCRQSDDRYPTWKRRVCCMRNNNVLGLLFPTCMTRPCESSRGSGLWAQSPSAAGTV